MKPDSEITGIEPQGVICWHTFGLLAALDQEERLILDRQARTTLANLLLDASIELHQGSLRLRLSPHKAEVLRNLQKKQPKHPSKN